MFGNQVTTKLIEQYLDRHGWRLHESLAEASEQQGIVRTGWAGANGEGHAMVIDPVVEKQCLTFSVPNVASAPPDGTASDRLSGLLTTMGYFNYALFLGSWGYDPRDGEVAFKLGIPIDDGKLSFEEFEHCLRVAIIAVEASGGSLRAIIDGSKTAIEVMREAGAKIG